MSVPPPWLQVLDFFGTPLAIEPSSGQLSSDAGLFPVREFDRHVALARPCAGALDEPGTPTTDSEAGVREARRKADRRPPNVHAA
jgi:hypothetical protein